MKWNHSHRPDNRSRQFKFRNSRLKIQRFLVGAALLLLAIAVTGPLAEGQGEAPFTVSNPKHKKWPVDQAERIYFAACERVAHAVRPEKPPQLQPKFVLVLGANNNELVRDGASAAIRLKNWDSAAFTEAVISLAAREVLNPLEFNNIRREVLLATQASISVNDLKAGQ